MGMISFVCFIYLFMDVKSDLAMFNRIILAHNLLKYAYIQARLNESILNYCLFIWSNVFNRITRSYAN